MPDHKQWSNIPGHWRSRLKPFARIMRHAPTEAEAALWKRLRRGQLLGVHFRRQHPIGLFIVDFFCVEHQLTVELDGEIHAEQAQAEYDAMRDEALRIAGVRLLRFTNSDVMRRVDWVLDQMAKAIQPAAR